MGPIKIFGHMAPIARGLGFAVVCVGLFLAFFYNVVVGVGRLRCFVKCHLLSRLAGQSGIFLPVSTLILTGSGVVTGTTRQLAGQLSIKMSAMQQARCSGTTLVLGWTWPALSWA